MDLKWWEKTTIYHIYPRSFKDSTGSGTGDLNGVISKLDYLKKLGVETLWLSPFFKSPGEDHGYDISDYYSIDPIMGNSQDIENLIEEVHKREMRIIFDFVINHTSDKHPWFKNRQDWYIWSKKPNNWLTMTGKKAWSYNPDKKKWYYSSFLNFQPDLNYRNPEVKKEMFNIASYWLKLGIDGFRLDIFNCIFKDKELRNNPFSPRFFPTPGNNDQGFFQYRKFNMNLKESVVLAKELRMKVDEFPQKFLIGEVSGNHDMLKSYIGNNRDGLNMVFFFELLHFKFSSCFFYNFLKTMETEFPYPYIPTLVFSNHDNGRFIGRVGNNTRKGKLIALFQLTSRGVPIIYYGDEIGMRNNNIPLRKARDPLARSYRFVPKWFAKIFDIYLNRDDARSPMQWDDNIETSRGFSDKKVEPWIPLLKKSEGIDVKTQIDNKESLFNTYKSLLELRNRYKELNSGTLELIDQDKRILSYKRVHGTSILYIYINFSRKTKEVSLKNNIKEVLFKTDNTTLSDNKRIILPGFSGIIIKT